MQCFQGFLTILKYFNVCTTRFLAGSKEFDWDNELSGKDRITLEDFVVLKHIYNCSYQEHHIEEITAIVNVITPGGTIVEEKIDGGILQRLRLLLYIGYRI